MALRFWSGRLDLNQRPLDPQAESTEPQATAGRGLTGTNAPACTTACTGEAENGHESRLEAIAAALSELPMGDRARLAAMLTADAEKGNSKR